MNKLMVIEDDAKIRAIMHEYLQKWGFTPFIADDFDKQVLYIRGGESVFANKSMADGASISFESNFAKLVQFLLLSTNTRINGKKQRPPKQNITCLKETASRTSNL